MSHQNNVSRIKIVCEALGNLREEVVFVGGSTVSLYADPQTFEVRETDDVDIIVELLTYSDRTKFEDRIQQLGFLPDVNSKINVRYNFQGITVDFMPTTKGTTGFENKWYPDGYKNARTYSIDGNVTAKILTPEYFLATKFEAFKSRGYSDPRQSHDFEDIVYVLENRNAIWSELASCSDPVKSYLKDEFENLLSQKGIKEWIDCHIDFVSPPSTDMIIDELKRFVNNS